MSEYKLHLSRSLRARDFQLPRDLVLIEANEEETRVGLIWTPVEYAETFPTSGWVHAVGPRVKENLQRGDFVLLEEEGTEVDHTYYDVFEVTLRDNDGSPLRLLADIEIEPVLKEQVEAFRRGGGPDNKITLKDKLKGDSVRFNCSDVLDWQFGNMANPRYDLTYVPTYMLQMLNDDDEIGLFYITPENKILATVEY